MRNTRRSNAKEVQHTRDQDFTNLTYFKIKLFVCLGAYVGTRIELCFRDFRQLSK